MSRHLCKVKDSRVAFGHKVARPLPELDLAYDDIKLEPDQTPPFVLNEQVRGREDFVSEWNASDLSRVMTSFAELAVNRYKHLAKNPEKTEAKIRM